MNGEAAAAAAALAPTQGGGVDGSEPGQVTIWPLVMLNVLINCPEVR